MIAQSMDERMTAPPPTRRRRRRHNPTQAEIAAATAKIRAGWTDRDWIERSVVPEDRRWRVPHVRVGEFR